MGDGDGDDDDGGGDGDDGGAVVVMMMAVMVMVVVMENAQSSKWVWVIKGRGSDRGVSRTSGYQAIRKSRHINLSPSSLTKMKIHCFMKSLKSSKAIFETNREKKCFERKYDVKY